MGKKKKVEEAPFETGEAGGGGVAVLDAPAIESHAAAVIRTEMIPLERVRTDGKNPRRADRGTPQDVEGLAANIRAVGQLTAIRVREVEDKQGTWYEIQLGHRRVAALRLIGATEVRAEIVQDSRGDEDVLRDRASENIQRSGPDPIEEALAMSGMVDAAKARGLDRDKAIQAVAAQIGKSPTWVRDRCYLTRLADPVRKMLTDELLPLGHAREIAKVVDPTIQEEIAADVAAKQGVDKKTGQVDWTPPADLEEVREMVRSHMYSLRVVTWRMDVLLPGVEAPACADCPFNSANDAALFEHTPRDGKVVAGGDDDMTFSSMNRRHGPWCTKPGCYDAKRDVADKTIRKQAAPALKALTAADVGVSETRLEEQKAVPTGIDVKAFTTQVRRERDKAAPAASGSSNGHAVAKPEKISPEAIAAKKVAIAREKAEREFWELERAWDKRQETSLEAALRAVPGRSSLLSVILASEMGSSLWAYGGEKSVPAVVLAALKRLNKPTISDFTAIEKANKNDPYCGAGDYLSDAGENFQDALRAALGLTLEPRPDRQKFLAAAEAKARGEVTKVDNPVAVKRDKHKAQKKKSKKAPKRKARK